MNKSKKPNILIAEDDASIRVIVSRALIEAGFEVRATPSVDALEKWVEAGEGDVVVSDVYLGEDSIFERIRGLKRLRPDLPFILMSGQNSILTAAASAEHGAFDYLPKPFDIDELVDLVRRAATTKKPASPQKMSDPAAPSDLSYLGRSGMMQKVYRSVTRIMNTKLPVFIHGEIGSGKYRTARAIHDLGNRRDGTFTTRLSDIGGATTLYVPEMSVLSAQEQGDLQDILRDETGPRVICGCTDMTQIGEKVDAALLQLTQTIIISMPPLRDRKEDISHIVNGSLLQAANDIGLGQKTFAIEAMTLLEKHDWPGNVKELENIVLRLYVFCPDTTIGSADVMSALIQSSNLYQPTQNMSFGTKLDRVISEHLWPQFLGFEETDDSQIHKNAIDSCEYAILKLALEFTGNNKLQAAKLLGMNRNTLRVRMEALGL